MRQQKAPEIWIELSNMECKKVELGQIYLDPNNPRIEIPGKEKLPDSRITEGEIQQKCLEQMKERGINDLMGSIKTSGFWTIDRVVLRPLDSDKYVVVEGNRRIVALKTLLESHGKGAITLPNDVVNGIKKFEALIYKGTDTEIAWVIQGFRHTPGIKSWERYPKAKFLADFEGGTKKPPQEIASIFGMRRAEVTHLIRSFHAFEQAKEDEDYGDMLDPDKFGHFDEIILRSSTLKEWMGWDDKQREFTQIDNLKKYLSWAVPEDGEKPKIDISPATRDVLPKLIHDKKLLEKFENGELSLRQCGDEIDKKERKIESVNVSDILNNLEEMKSVLNTLPIPRLQLAESTEGKNQKKQLRKILEELAKIVEVQIKNLKD